MHNFRLPTPPPVGNLLPPSRRLQQLAAGGRPVHGTDLRTTKFYRTQLCPFLRGARPGRCSQGLDCGYAHCEVGISRTNEICASWRNRIGCVAPVVGKFPLYLQLVLLLVLYAPSIQAELRKPPTLERTKWCPLLVQGGSCNRPSCGYAHDPEELQVAEDSQTLKTAICAFWAKDPSLCLNQDKCRYQTRYPVPL